MIILTDKQIRQKLTRLAYEIIEQNTDVKEVILAGINNNGLRLAKLIKSEIDAILGKDNAAQVAQIKLDPASPRKSAVTLSIDPDIYRQKSVIIVDDVANTGRTLFYTFQLFLDTPVKRLKIAVMIDRKHKAFPVKVDHVGLSLATTAKENIHINLSKSGQFDAVLQ